MSIFGLDQDVRDTNTANENIAKRTNIANAEMARQQAMFQKYMSDTSHQREVRDLRKAGLNPILSANKGASTPSGASANQITGAAMQAPDRIGKAMQLIGGMNSALSSVQQVKQLQATDAQIAKTVAETKSIPYQREQTQAHTVKTASEGRASALEVQKRHAELPAIKSEASLRRTRADIDKAMAPYDAAGSRIKSVIDTILDAWGGVSSAASKRSQTKKNDAIRDAVGGRKK